VIWRSVYPAVEPVPALLDDDVLAAAARHPARLAIAEAFTGRALTFGQLADGARRLAGGLAERGIGGGDVVAIIAANGPDHAVAMYGALAAGAAVASANPALTAPELARQFDLTRPRMVVADETSMATVAEALRGRDAILSAVDDLPGLLAAPAPWSAGRDPRDVALLYPSSGTSGMPKVAVHTHATATAFFQAAARTASLRLSPADVVGDVIPFGHLFGSALLSHGLRAGASVVTLARFEVEAFLRMLQDHAVTVAPVTPPLLAALASHPLVDRLDLSSLRRLICSAAPCPPGLPEAVEARVGCRVADHLGTTEAWCVGAPPEPPVRGTVGRLGANLEATIVDPGTGAPLGPGEAGELWIQGPYVLRGYLGDDDGIDPDGWLHTGDVCRFDADGNLFIVDRLKELIKVGGYSVAPLEVERALLTHPAVADAGVVGRPDPELGQVPAGYVVLRGPAEPAELQAWLEDRLAPWKQPRAIEFLERLPRTPAGKLLRRQLGATSRPSSARRETPSLA
jgi:acyl-CoA synthetase (AMP-forming)/AMP-acid ligase II